MAEKRRVKLPGRFMEENAHWYVVQFTLDKEYSDQVCNEDIEDEFGKTGEDRSFNVGDNCSAYWKDGISYEGVVVFVSEDKEKSLKFREQITKKKTSAKRKAPAKNKKDTDLAKKKREANEEKKKIEAQKQETAISNAKELFQESMRVNANVHVGINSTVDQPINVNHSNITNACPQPSTIACTNQAPPVSNVTVSHQSGNCTSITPLTHYTNQRLLPSTTPNTYPQPFNMTNHTQQLRTPVPLHSLTPYVNKTPHTATTPSTGPQPSNNNMANGNPAPIPPLTHYYANQSPIPSSFPTTNSQPNVVDGNPVPLPPLTHYANQRPLFSTTPAIQSNVANSTLSSLPPLTHYYANQSPIPSSYPTTNSQHNVADGNSVALPPLMHCANQRPVPSTTPAFQSNVANSSTPSTLPPLTHYQANLQTTTITNCPQPAANLYTCTSSCSPTFTDQNQPSSFLSPVVTNPLLNFTNLTNPDINYSQDDHQVAVSSAECFLKDKQIESLKSFNEKLESDVIFWKEETTRLTAQLDQSSMLDSSMTDGKVALFDSKDHYTPSRGTRINKCNYRILEDSQPIHTGYIPLVDGHPVIVPVPWLCDLQGAYKGKTKTCALKLMFNGFFQPKEVVGKTGLELAETQIGKAMKAYALKTFLMDVKSVIGAFNSKIGTMARAHKKMTSKN